MSETEVSVAPTKSKSILNEDWAVVIIGFLIIGVVLSGMVVPVPSFGWTNTSDLTETIFTATNFQKILLQFLVLLLAGIGAAVLTGIKLRDFIITFISIYFLTTLALVIAGNRTMKDYNLEAVIFSLLIGLLISNTLKLPDWFRKSITSELFVKIGLVLLGTSIIFGDILKAGGLGLIQSLVVVISVWYFAFWLCKKMRIDDEMTMMLSSAVSICGVSAAIATSGAIKGDNKKLSYIISLVLIVAIPMMIFMPYLAKLMGLSQEVTGAWLGGTIDTSGAVVAAGTLVGEEALKISTIVKFSQNVLLGIAAFAISVYWTYTGRFNKSGVDEKPTLKVIWQRFPKFVLGFILASLFFSFVLSGQQVAAVKDSLKSVQNLWFALAFTAIGLETRFADLFKQENRKPLYAFLIAQFFNILITLAIAWLLFQ